MADLQPKLDSYLYACLTTCTVVSTAVVALRVYTKAAIVKNLGWDDYTCVSAWIGLLTIIVLGFLSPPDQATVAVYGSGRRAWIQWLKFQAPIQILYSPTIFLTKLSILLQYIKIFLPSRKGKLYRVAQGTIWANLLFYIGCMIVDIIGFVYETRDDYISAISSLAYQAAAAFNQYQYLATASLNVASDFLMLLLPLISISRLQLKPGRKVGIAAVFATAIFACIASIMRLVASVKDYLKPNFPISDLTVITLWSYAEITSGVLCACTASLAQFFRHIYPKVFQLSRPKAHINSTISMPLWPQRVAEAPLLPNGSQTPTKSLS